MEIGLASKDDRSWSTEGDQRVEDVALQAVYRWTDKGS